MEGRTSKIAVTAGLVGLIVAASIAIEVRREDHPSATIPPVTAPAPPDAAKLDAELERCNRLGPNDGPDQGCLDAWAEARRHFLGGKP